MVESFILRNISKFDGLIPIKIYQKYLVSDIKKLLSEYQLDFVKNQLSGSSNGNFEKVHHIFKKIICLPISKFDSVVMKE